MSSLLNQISPESMPLTSQNFIPSQKFDFIDTIRCIAMAFIVAEHCITAGGFVAVFGSRLFWPFLLLNQTTKFGTIVFFLIAGFLLGDKFGEYKPGQYFKRRLVKIVGPWLFWSFIYLCIDFTLLYINSHKYHNGRFNLHNIYDSIKGLYLLSNYWFILNYIMSIGILLIFRKYLYTYFLGCVLCFFTLFYSVNIYYNWIFSSHTTAILGFVFFLWLGAQIRRKWFFFDQLISATRYSILVILVLISYAACIGEVLFLHFKGIETTNTLRLTNIFFSLTVFFLLLKLRTFRLIELLNPRQTTFGIYLIHYILIVFLLPVLTGNSDIKNMTGVNFILFRISNFVTIYVITLIVVFMINKSKFSKLIGGNR